MGKRINKAHLSKLQLSQSHVLLYFLKTSSFFEKKEKFFCQFLRLQAMILMYFRVENKQTKDKITS